MTITLPIVRDLLRDSFGRNSFIASFIKSIEEDPSIATAGITEEGRLRYNPDFVKRYVARQSDLFCLIVHELLHPMFGHFIYDTRQEIEAVATDAIINANISVAFHIWSENGSLMQKFYAPNGVEGLLRLGSDMRHSRYSSLYHRLYQQNNSTLTAGDVISTLRILTPAEDAQAVTLLGSHGGAESLSRDVVGEIAEDMRHSLRKLTRRSAGLNTQLYEMLLDAIASHRSIKRILLQRYTTQRKLDRFLHPENAQRITSSPIPTHPSKRDLVLLASGMMPFRYSNLVTHIRNGHRGLAVYLDVSGSVNEYLPKIVGLLRNMKRELTSIFLFSNKVVEVPFSELLKGRVNTTYGTDFNCVADSMIERGWDKAVVLTDGYAELSEEKRAELKRKNVRTLTLLFGGLTESSEWAATGDVCELEAVTT